VSFGGSTALSVLSTGLEAFILEWASVVLDAPPWLGLTHGTVLVFYSARITLLIVPKGTFPQHMVIIDVCAVESVSHLAAVNPALDCNLVELSSSGFAGGRNTILGLITCGMLTTRLLLPSADQEKSIRS
jgi:hypothetical protein